MKLTPHEILTHIGIDVPEEGVTISSHDMLVYTRMFHLLGKQMSIDKIATHELKQLISEMQTGDEGPVDVSTITDRQCDFLRSALKCSQRMALGMDVDLTTARRP